MFENLNISLQRSGVTIKTFLLACAVFICSINVNILTLFSGIIVLHNIH